MVASKRKLAISLLFLGLAACERDETTESNKVLVSEARAEALYSSEKIAKAFPLLPLVEKRRWSQLLGWESSLADPSITLEAHNALIAKVDDLSRQLESEYPFSSDEETVTLGGIRYYKEDKRIEIPAVVSYPTNDEGGQSHEVEVALCTNKGRVHETLFVTDCRPLHLELLLLLTGSEKLGSNYQLFIALPGSPLLPLRHLLESTTDGPLVEPLFFSFTGASFEGAYSPDAAGDLIITWHAHDAVLQVADEDIAQARTRLKAVRHSDIENGMHVRLVLRPVKSLMTD